MTDHRDVLTLSWATGYQVDCACGAQFTNRTYAGAVRALMRHRHEMEGTDGTETY